MISYDEALQRVIDSISPLQPKEVSLLDAAGLTLASPAAARWDMPRCDNSAMDGFAICAPIENIETGLAVIGSSYAGQPFAGKVKAGEAVRITTGAILPDGANTVVPIEESNESDGLVYISKPPKSGQHVRYRGEEYTSGEAIVAAGTKLRAGEIALLASAGVERVSVYPRPRVAVISTGDELIDLGKAPKPGQIINSNLYFLKTRLLECGCIPICLGIGSDDTQNLGQLVEQALEADVIISTGGVSIGEKDLVQTTLGQYDFEKIFWKVAIKPGKPFLYGKLGNKPFFGLPGNPGATAATYEVLVKPALKKLAGQPDFLPTKRMAILSDDVSAGGKRQAFLWSSLEWQQEGYTVSVSPRQSSGQTRCLLKTNALLTVPIEVKKIAKGETVDVFVINDSP